MEEEIVNAEQLRHQHPLLLKQNVMMYERCGVCSMSGGISSFYFCESCGYSIHKRCARLPHQIDHPFHPSHPLSLIPRAQRIAGVSCNSCHRSLLFYDDPIYGCNHCEFYMDCRCATMEPIQHEDDDEVDLLRHFSHQHPMTLLAEDEPHQMFCVCCACSRGCQGLPTYACKRCACFLHESCKEVPHEIEHPFHPRHSLSLFVNNRHFRCKLCRNSAYFAFAYKCQPCMLQLCVACATNAPMRRTRPISYKLLHHHPLFLEETFSAEAVFICSGFEACCSKPFRYYCDELARTRSFVHHCLECDFTLHLLCGPLPSTIKHDCHVDPLSLVDYLVEDDYPDDEWYCDVCEKKRDPRVQVYHCKDCKFVAHVHCVVSEIAKVLKGHLGNAKLKSVGEEGDWECEIYSNDQLVLQERSNSDMCLGDVVDKLTRYEKELLRRRRILYHTPYPSVDLGDNKTLTLPHFTVEEFQKLVDSYVRNFRFCTGYELSPSLTPIKVMEIEGYIIPQIMAQALRALINKYGDVSDQRMSREWRSIIYFVLCTVVKQMQSIKVVDITLGNLLHWFSYLKFVGEYGRFQIDFARTHLDCLTRAFVGSQAKRLEYEIPNKLKNRIAQLQKEIKEREETISSLTASLKVCDEYQSGASPKSNFVKKCEKMALDLKWKSASEGLFSHPNQTYVDHYEIWQWPSKQ